MQRSELTWAPHIPLIGGFPLGAEKALGKPPVKIISLPGFEKNDSHYVHYQNEILKRNLKYEQIDPDDLTFKEKINIIVSTPPCAGLSQLNSGKKDSDVKGAGCKKNEFMYICAEQAIKCFDADAIIIENAPALYTSKGRPVVEKLYKIAKDNKYSLSLYKTSTMFHGIPQNRVRTFAFLWKSDKTPELKYYKKEFPNVIEYLKQIPKDALHSDILVNHHCMNEPYYQFLQHYYKTNNPRDQILTNSHTAHSHVMKLGLLDKFISWAEENHEKGHKLGLHAREKFSRGLGVWDGSVHVFKEHFNAVIGRALAESIHPTEDRALNIREAFHLMGFPHDFELLGGKKNLNHIAQNVPVCTAADMVSEAADVICGDRYMIDSDFIRQNNFHKKIDEQGWPEENNCLSAFL
jgi:site-specific DNA-cytosine methylase